MSEERGRKREGEGEEGKEGGSRSTRSERERGGVIGKKKKNSSAGRCGVEGII